MTLPQPRTTMPIAEPPATKDTVIDDDQAGAPGPSHASAETVELRVRVPAAEVERLARQLHGGCCCAISQRETRDLREAIKQTLRARKARIAAFPGVPMADPAWDILLEVYLARLEGRRMSVSKLCEVSGAAPTTTLRQLGLLVRAGYLTREADPKDGRRVLVQLTKHTRPVIDAMII